MNIEIANRLLEFRKKSGLSQEELAEKLNISRQSVSKWERAESCPDTDNLIELAKIYNVTLDDLINVDKPIKEEAKVDEKKVESSKIEIDEDADIAYSSSENCDVYLKNDKLVLDRHDDKKVEISFENVYLKEKDQKINILDAKEYFNQYTMSIKKHKIKDAICGSLIFVVLILYILLCSLNIQDWGKFWVIFVLYPALVSAVEAIFLKDLRKFAFPVFIAALYLFLGMYFDLWHPFWFVFLLIPLYYTIIDAFKQKVTIYYLNENNEEYSFLIEKKDIKIK